MYQVLIAALPLITAPYLARVLGAEKIGEYSFAHSIVSCFVLVAVAGTSLYGQRTIARSNVLKESQKQILAEILLLRIVGVGASAMVYFGMMYRGVDNHGLYAIVAIEILATVFDISWFYQGIEKFDVVTTCNGACRLLSAVCIFVFVKTQEDLNTYAAIYATTILLGNGVQWYFLPRHLQKGPLAKMDCLRHVKPAAMLFLSQIAIQTYTVLDKVMIGLISGSDLENGYYDQAQKLIRTMTALITSLGAVMASRVSIVWCSQDPDRENELERLFLFSFRLVLALGIPVAVGLDLIATRFVPVFFGDGYEPVVILLKLLAWTIPLVGCSNIIGMQCFVPSGREELVTKSVMMGAAVNVCLNLLMIGRWGALGAVIASVVAELVVTAIQFVFAYRELPVKKILGMILRYGALSAVMWIAGTWLSGAVSAGFGGMMGIIVLCMGVYALLLVVTKDKILKIWE